NSADNTATSTVAVKPSADLAVTQTASPSPAIVGTPVTYTLTATNNGPSASTGTTITDTLPAGITFVTVTPDKGSCTLGLGTFTCNLGLLAAGAGVRVTVNLTPLATGSGTLTNAASISGGQTDSVPGNNSSSLGVPIVAASAAADLAVSASAVPT